MWRLKQPTPTRSKSGGWPSGRERFPLLLQVWLLEVHLRFTTVHFTRSPPWRR